MEVLVIDFMINKDEFGFVGGGEKFKCYCRVDDCDIEETYVKTKSICKEHCCDERKGFMYAFLNSGYWDFC